MDNIYKTKKFPRVPPPTSKPSIRREEVNLSKLSPAQTFYRRKFSALNNINPMMGRPHAMSTFNKTRNTSCKKNQETTQILRFK